MKRWISMVFVVVVLLSATTKLFGAFDSPRSGEIFQTTREGPGEVALGLIYFGMVIPPLGIATIPAGIAVAAVDELVVSPVIDLVCLPYDLMQERHGFVIRVRDSDGRPVEGASFWSWLSTNSILEDTIRETTDANGEIFVPKLNRVSLSRVEIHKSGFYDYREHDGELHYKVYEKDPGDDGRIVFDFTIKRKIRSVEKNKSKLEWPNALLFKSVDLYYDCELGDWLPPHGKGKTADLLVSQKVEVKDDAKPRNAYRIVREYSTVGAGNGFVADDCNWYDGLHGRYEAPSSGEYAPSKVGWVSCWRWNGAIGSEGSQHIDRSKYMILRLRTRFGEDGKVISAHYGKLLFPTGWGCDAYTVFVRDENERWME